MQTETKEKIPFEKGYYEGELKDGIPNGKGVYYDSDEEIYHEGNWVNGLLHGKGKVTAITFHYIYKGDFVNGDY
ncbi:MAG: hypothetical protein FWB83_10220, partial [Treponema sp.]|nr:hypothetical protein [Treponema sp.]